MRLKSSSGTAKSGSARERLEACLVRIEDPAGDGARTCLTVYTQSSRAAADAADARAKAGTRLGPLNGTIVTVKDLFDVKGEITRAGSPTLLQEGRVAADDAVVIKRLCAAGAVIVAKTNMSEFAFSGTGVNPHFGTPRNPLDKGRVPGGSSSGAAVAVAAGFGEISVGTDTGGSARIPAALCGVVGFKPTQARVPRIGAFPLSKTLEAVGPIGPTVEACATMDAVLSKAASHIVPPIRLAGLRVVVVQGLPLESLEEAVAQGFEKALSLLGAAAVSIAELKAPELDAMRQINQSGGISTAEAFTLHINQLARSTAIDPNILARIKRGSSISAADHLAMLEKRRALIEAMMQRLDGFDAVVMPTVPIVAPTFDQVASAEGFASRNQLLLRNTVIANFFDCPAISLPLGDAYPGVGFMMMAQQGCDQHLFGIARAVEALFLNAT